jgi:DNA-binding MarR family transcriptional regulator
MARFLGMVFTPTDAEEEWFGLLGARERVVAAMERELHDRHDLSMAALVILLALVKHEEELAMTDLVPLVAIVSRSQVSRIVDGLEARGLVKRNVDQFDARIRRATITTAGLRLLAAARKTADNASQEALTALSAGDHAALRRLWSRLVREPDS